MLDLYKSAPRPDFPFLLGDTERNGAINFPYYYHESFSGLLKEAYDIDNNHRQGGQSHPRLYDSLIRLSLQKKSLQFLVDSNIEIDDSETKDIIQSGMKIVKQKIQIEKRFIRSLTDQNKIEKEIADSAHPSQEARDKIERESRTFSNVTRFINNL